MQAEIPETSNPSIKVQTHVLDFATATPQSFTALKQSIDALGDIGMLINNVGKSHAHPEYFDILPQEEVDQILKINVEGLVQVTRLVVPKMKTQ